MAEIQDVMDKLEDVMEKLGELETKIGEPRVEWKFCPHCNGDGLNEPSVGGACVECNGTGFMKQGRNTTE